MNNRTEQQLTKLEKQVQDFKQSFERSAYALELYTATASASFGTNRYSASDCSVLPTGSRSVGRGLIVTYATTSGVNTLAKIKIDDHGFDEDFPQGLSAYEDRPHCRRIPYAGGVRWIVTPPFDNLSQMSLSTSSPYYSSPYNPIDITVYATQPGELTVEAL